MHRRHDSPARCWRSPIHNFPLVTFPSTVCRRDLSRFDLVLEAVRIEGIEPAVGRFRLWVHKESNWRAVRSWEGHIVREVVGHPVHLPRTEQTYTGFFHHLIVQ